MSPLLLLAMLVGVLGLAAIVVGYRMRPAQKSLLAVMVAALPAVLMLGLFFSLAVHMHGSLGAWPQSIGERGFPSALVTHADITESYFSVLFLVSVFAWPIVFLVCLLVRRWRVSLYYLGV